TRPSSDLGVAIAGAFHFVLRPIGVGHRHAVLPAHMVPGVDPGFEARVRDGAHDVRCASAYVGPGDDSPIHQRSHPVVTYDRRAPDLAVETGTEDALDRTARVIGTEREQERRVDAVLARQRYEVGDTLSRAAQRVDIDLESELHQDYSTSRLASATRLR